MYRCKDVQMYCTIVLALLDMAALVEITILGRQQQQAQKKGKGQLIQRVENVN